MFYGNKYVSGKCDDTTEYVGDPIPRVILPSIWYVDDIIKANMFDPCVLFIRVFSIACKT